MVTCNETLAGLRALVVEDESLIAEEIRQRLTDLGMEEVTVVDSGELALEMARTMRPDLVLMDIRLRGKLDGIETAARLGRVVSAPVVFLTAHSDEQTLRRAKSTDPFGYLLKPFNDRELTVTLEMCLHRHQLQRKLKESELRYAATLSSIGDGVIATDADGHITFMNPVAEALTGWSREHAVRQSVGRVFVLAGESGEPQGPHPMVDILLQGRTDFDCAPCVLLTRNNERIPIDHSIAPITDDEGEVLGAVAAFRDIRQRKLAEDALLKAQDQLRQAQKMEAVGRLAGGIAHDFNNLLAVIRGSAEMLLETDDPEGEGRILIQEILDTGDRAARLIRQLLTFSRDEIPQPETVHLDRLLQEAEALLDRLLAGRAELSVSAEDGLWAITADPGQIEQVLLNLAVNARDAMPNGGRLTIAARNLTLPPGAMGDLPANAPGPYVQLIVADNGEGMDEDVRERIFEPFFTTKQKDRGTGLGLATVYAIVRQTGGFITVRSKPGRGTTFLIHFPALQNSTAPVPLEPGEDSAAFRGCESILLVDDDASVRQVLAAALGRQGYHVLEAGNGTEALQLMSGRDEPIQLLVTDVMMQGMGGLELSRRMTAEHPGLHTILISGWTDDPALRQGVMSGEHAFLMKPFNMAALLEKLRQVLDGRGCRGNAVTLPRRGATPPPGRASRPGICPPTAPC